MELFAVEDLPVTRFAPETQAGILLARCDDGNVVLEALGPGRQICIGCASAHVSAIRGYMRLG
jgi:hypothetical protein